MELPFFDAQPTGLPRPAAPCAQCGVMIAAPEWSEVFDECRIRHLWSCTFCGYEFETTVFYAAPAPDAEAA
jgi:hypothetical protein